AETAVRPASCLPPRPWRSRPWFASRANIGYRSTPSHRREPGLRSPILSGYVIADVDARMNRILEIDETLCFAAIEPGVTYQQVYDELGPPRTQANDGSDFGTARRRHNREDAR